MQPPQHDIDAAPFIVVSGDPAWDHESVMAETKGLNAEELAEHPYVAYMSGRSRYDLTAEFRWKGGLGSASDYLDADTPATRIELRRLNLRERCEITDATRREQKKHGKGASLLSVYYEAARMAVVAVHGARDLEFRKGTEVPDDVLEKLCDRLGGLDVVAQIGSAAVILSYPLNEAEKKP